MGADDSSARARIPYDILIVVGLAFVLVAVSLAPLADRSPIRLVLAVVAVFLPGYSLIAALFPRRRLPPSESPGTLAERARQVDGFDRTVLSVGAGLLVTPLLGIALDFSPWPYREGPIVATVLAFVLVTSAVAAVRRRRLPAEEQYAPAERWRGAVEGFDPTEPHQLVTVVVAVAVLVAAGGVISVASTGQTGERFTEFYVLGTDNGTLVAGSYPHSISAGETVTVTLGIENGEGSRQTYTVVPRLQNVSRESNRTRIYGQESFGTTRLTVGRGGTVRRNRTVRPSMTGRDLRLVFLLYKGDPPATPTTGNAYRRVHLWLNVTG